MAPKEILYVSADKRFFILPAGNVLPKGELVLYNFTGAALHVDPEEATQFEVDEEVAEAHVHDGVLHFFRNAGETLTAAGEQGLKIFQDALDEFREKHRPEDDAPASSPGPEPAAEPTEEPTEEPEAQQPSADVPHEEPPPHVEEEPARQDEAWARELGHGLEQMGGAFGQLFSAFSREVIRSGPGIAHAVRKEVDSFNRYVKKEFKPHGEE